jgi:hypothetical protein
MESEKRKKILLLIAGIFTPSCSYGLLLSRNVLTEISELIFFTQARRLIAVPSIQNGKKEKKEETNKNNERKEGRKIKGNTYKGWAL